ncbi:MAG: MBL fold metallo-hydrolase [Lentisphaerae bacterium GWF2_45_14]|nr:MAG: MBL fold metallo-hydrolase [Lentisphaerae bacterium GWF2_45_14]
MESFLQAVKVTEKVYWVGAIDWAIKDFHGYSTERGTTYNAFLILSDKITLVDTVKAPFIDEMFARISSIIDPSKIDYIISNHSEPDHSGALPETIRRVKPQKIFASLMGEKNLKAHYSIDQEITPVKTGDSVSLGNMTVDFIETRMLHWPDSMFSYLREEKVLFSQDAFGMHLASDRLFADEIEHEVLYWEAEKYFANILMPYSQQVQKLAADLPGFNLDIKTLAPDHGPLWRKNISEIIGWYVDWSAQKPENFAIVVYDTMWQSTALMARSIADGIKNSGSRVELIPLSAKDRSYVATKLLRAGALVVGSPTLNNNIFPTLSDVLTYVKGLRPKNKIGVAFGSYGWGGEAAKQVDDILKSMDVEIVSEPLRMKYVPKENDLKKCFELGAAISATLREKTK